MKLPININSQSYSPEAIYLLFYERNMPKKLLWHKKDFKIKTREGKPEDFDEWMDNLRTRGR